MKTLFSQKELRGERITLVVILVAAGIAVVATVAHLFSDATAPSQYRAVVVMSVGVLLAANQIRIYRVIRNAAEHAVPTIDEVAKATAELVAAQHRDFERMLNDIEEDFRVRLASITAAHEDPKVVPLRARHVVEDVI